MYIYTSMRIHMCVYIYIYIYILRRGLHEGVVGRRDLHAGDVAVLEFERVNIYIYIYTYTYTYTYT